MTKLTVKEIKRPSHNWGLWDSAKEEFVELYHSKKDAEKRLKELSKHGGSKH